MSVGQEQLGGKVRGYEEHGNQCIPFGRGDSLEFDEVKSWTNNLKSRSEKILVCKARLTYLDFAVQNFLERLELGMKAFVIDGLQQS